MSTIWFVQLDRAKSVPDVISVARDFMATWTPAELATLPEECRPARLRDEHDIEALHSCLVEQYRASRATGPDLQNLQRLTSFVVRASIRLAELAPPSSDAPGGGPEGPAKSAAARRRE